MNNGLTQEVEDQIVALWNKGWLPYLIGPEVGVCAATAYRVIRRRKDAVRRVKIPKASKENFAFRQMVLDHDETIRRMVAEGATNSEIACVTGLAPSTVARYARTNQLRHKVVLTDATRQIIIEMAGAGRTWKDIREASGVSQDKAETVIREAGLWPKPKLDGNVGKDDPPWFPGPDDPKYDDDFQLKPADRARLEYVKYRRNIGQPIGK